MRQPTISSRLLNYLIETEGGKKKRKRKGEESGERWVMKRELQFFSHIYARPIFDRPISRSIACLQGRRSPISKLYISYPFLSPPPPSPRSRTLVHHLRRNSFIRKVGEFMNYARPVFRGYEPAIQLSNVAPFFFLRNRREAIGEKVSGRERCISRVFLQFFLLLFFFLDFFFLIFENTVSSSFSFFWKII